MDRAAAVVQTMRRAFPALETFAVKGPWKTGQMKAENLIFFGGHPIETGLPSHMVAKVTEMAMNRQLPIEAIALLNSRRAEPWPAGVELSDDFAPYDLLIGREESKMQPGE